MSRQYSPYSTTRDGFRSDYDATYGTDYGSDYATDYGSRFGSDLPTDRQRRYDDHDPAYDTDADYAADYEYPADYHETLDRRWIWVAGVAGAILMIAVVCTGVILGGGDSGTVTAASTSAAPTDDAVTTTPATPPAPAADLPGADMAPERVTTVTPTPSATVAPEPAPTVAAPAPVAPPAPPAPPAAVDPAAAARTVTYQVTGNRQLIDLVTIIYTDAQGALQTDVNVALPWVKSVTLNPGVTLSSVTATSVAGQLNCAILDGNGTALAVQANDSMIATCTR